VVVSTCNPSTLEPEAGKSQVQGQTELHRETLSKQANKNRKKGKTMLINTVKKHNRGSTKICVIMYTESQNESRFFHMEIQGRGHRKHMFLGLDAPAD
jgi:hypothetical protein